MQHHKRSELQRSIHVPCIKYSFTIAGQDSTLRSFSTVHDRHSKNLGRASFNKKKTKKSGLKHDQYCMPPITHITSGKLFPLKVLSIHSDNSFSLV